MKGGKEKSKGGKVMRERRGREGERSH